MYLQNYCDSVFLEYYYTKTKNFVCFIYLKIKFQSKNKINYFLIEDIKKTQKTPADFIIKS